MKNKLLNSTADQEMLQSVLDELRAGIKSIYKEKAPSIRIYGSYARGDANPGSDIDVLLIYPEKVRQVEEIRRLGALLAEINLRYQVLISLLPTDEKEYRRSSIGFWRNVRKESKPIEAI
jgi:predicted nucleotidyltransferase